MELTKVCVCVGFQPRRGERMSTARQEHPDRTALAEAGVFAVSKQWMKAECGF